MFQQFELAEGRYGGALVQGAETRLSDAASAASMTITLLDSIGGSDHLAQSLTTRALIDDMKFGRRGYEWHEERQAIAAQTVEDFVSSWPEMKKRLRESQLVSVVSCLENYVLSVIIEFPSLGENIDFREVVSDEVSDTDWERAESFYRKAMKAKRSASAAWVSLCKSSSLPESSKARIAQWGDDRVSAIFVDEMTVLRNVIVHKAGIVGEKTAKQLTRLNVKLGMVFKTGAEKAVERMNLAT